MTETTLVRRWGTRTVVTDEFWADESARKAFLDYQEVMLERGARDAGGVRISDRPMSIQTEPGVSDDEHGPRHAYPGETPDCLLVMLSIFVAARRDTPL